MARTTLTRRRFLLVAGQLGLGAALAACSPTTNTAPTKAPAAGSSTPVPATAVPVARRFTVRTNVEGAANPDFDEMPQIWAHRSGLFEENGVDFELIATGEGAGVATQGLQLLLTEKIDFSEILLPGELEPVIDGADLVGLGAIEADARYGYWLVTKSDIKDWQDLVGRKYVISSPGGPPDGIGRYVMNKHNVPVDQVTFVPLGGSSARTQALIAGQVDAALIHPQYALGVVRDNPGLHIFSDLADSPLMWSIDATFSRNVKENRDMVLAWVKTCLQAKRAFNADRDLAVNAYLEVVPDANRDDIIETWENYVKLGIWEPNGGLDRELYDATLDAYLDIGGITKKVEWDSFMDTSIVEDVLKDIGRV